ncbi:hypothetical protein ACQFN5_15215 [Klebsiella sp. WOUb02]|uniref:hypothetical protein n=1 Tax=Klebsiella sp. WOUb02 TaxID=3161071 RepID=UPI003CF0F11C
MMTLRQGERFCFSPAAGPQNAALAQFFARIFPAAVGRRRIEGSQFLPMKEA